ncbi:hypothetical protein ACFLT4_00950 [Chloroflexota bacterium]
MEVTASRETEAGFELEPVTKKLTLDKARMFHGWPRNKNAECDYAEAHKKGMPKPFIQANHIYDYIGEQLIKFFGQGYIGGHISVKVIRIIWVDDEITVKMVVREKVIQGDTIRLILGVSCENKHDEQVIVGTASGLVH